MEVVRTSSPPVSGSCTAVKRGIPALAAPSIGNRQFRPGSGTRRARLLLPCRATERIGVEPMRSLPMRRTRGALLAAVCATLLGGCGLFGPPSPPRHGKPAVNVAYRVELGCPEAFQLGGWLWRFRDRTKWPPPVNPDVRWQPRDPAPGIVTLTSARSGAFVADSDHVEYRIVRVRKTDGHDWLCPEL